MPAPLADSDLRIIETAAALGNLTAVQAQEDLRRLRADPTNPKAPRWERQLQAALQRLKQD